MIRFIIFLILCYILYRLLKSLLRPPAQPGYSPSTSPPTITDEMVRDPYCHVYLPKRDALTAPGEGETIYFCSKECREKYLKEKEQQIRERKAEKPQ